MLSVRLGNLSRAVDEVEKMCILEHAYIKGHNGPLVGNFIPSFTLNCRLCAAFLKQNV